MQQHIVPNPYFNSCVACGPRAVPAIVARQMLSLRRVAIYENTLHGTLPEVGGSTTSIKRVLAHKSFVCNDYPNPSQQEHDVNEMVGILKGYSI
eukprot:3256067-Amphidinium_carterae.1